MRPDPIARAIAARLTALQASQRLSAWSLIVTFLGDAIGPRGGEVSAAAVQALMARLGIGHGAVRTAVSRLAADSWIERTREGRNSFYRLSPGVAQTVLEAEQRIYAGASLLAADTPRSLIIAGQPLAEAQTTELDRLGALALGDRVFLCFTPAQDALAALPGTEVSGADISSFIPSPLVQDRLRAARLADEFSALSGAYRPILKALEKISSLDPEDAITLRCLMIHEWRRMALRVLAIPADLAPKDDAEPETRALIARIYRELLAPSERWLDSHAATVCGSLPPAHSRLARRFETS